MGGFVSRVMVNPRIEIDRAEFPFCLPVLREFERLDLHPNVTFFIGDNGSGKSTFLEAIATNYGFPAEGGSRNHQFSTYDSHTDLGDKLILGKPDHPKTSYFFRSETFYNFATYLERSALELEVPDVPKFGWTHKRSHGEGFLDTMNALEPNGLYLMDEPEAALSVQGQFTFLAHMKRLVDAGSQFIIATHSPILMAYPNARIFMFGDDAIREVRYEETEHYTVTRDFLEHRETMLRELLQSPQMELDEADEK
ncbi:MAG: AAA family ATPase [Fimbriimonadaceae bacterium]